MKNLRNLKNKILSESWYRQGASVKPLYISYPWLACFEFSCRGRRLPIWYFDMKVFLKREYMEVYFPERTMRTIARYYLNQENRQPGTTKKLFRIWQDQENKKFQFAINAELKTGYNDLSDEELLSRFKNFSELYSRLWRESIFLDAFDVAGDLLLAHLLSKSPRKPTEGQLRALTAPAGLTWLQQEKRDLLMVADWVRSRRVLLKALIRRGDSAQLLRAYPDLSNRISEHTDRYAWMANDYAKVRVLTPVHFLNELRFLLRNPKSEKYERARVRIGFTADKNRKKVLRDLRFSAEINQLFDFMSILALWRDYRKSFNQRAGSAIRRFALEFSRRTETRLNSVEHVFWSEMPAYFRSPGKFKSLINSRLSGAFFIDPYHPTQKASFITGAKARLINDYLKSGMKKPELRGRTAYPGFIRGEVRIVLSQKDFKKIRGGEILVSANTRPEFVPVMKLAGAIVTEEGGVTSHAAIVSRELRKPCIVGVQGILESLRDNDTVIVDATKGVIKIL